jgi:hypothetical protein
MHQRHEAANLRRLDFRQRLFVKKTEKQLECMRIVLQRRRGQAALMPEGIEVLDG